MGGLVWYDLDMELMRETALFNLGWFGGAIIASIVTFGTNSINSNFSWRIPLILQAVACLVIVFTIFTIPESPRFLMANGKEDEALGFLIKYHGGGDPDSKLVALEIAEFRESISQIGSDKRSFDCKLIQIVFLYLRLNHSDRPLFRTKNARWRMYQVIGMSVAGQFSGNGLAYFNTVIYGKLGVDTVSKQLEYNIGFQLVSAFGAFCGALLTDRMPRRKVLVIGTFGKSFTNHNSLPIYGMIRAVSLPPTGPSADHPQSAPSGLPLHPGFRARSPKIRNTYPNPSPKEPSRRISSSQFSTCSPTPLFKPSSRPRPSRPPSGPRDWASQTSSQARWAS